MTKNEGPASPLSDANAKYALGTTPAVTQRLRRQVDELLSDLEDPRTIAVSGFLFLGWARKPA